MTARVAAIALADEVVGDVAATSVAADPEHMIGRELTPFRITGAIGHGAMGRVYAAEHVVLGRRVAIKVMEPRFARDPDGAARFVEEARAVSRIRHPNIVDIIDFGDLDGRPYYVMELLGGETLAARIARRGGLSATAAVPIAIGIASALAAAHDHGVIHRDLKPDNIFLCDHPDEPDRVKVLDFGVAKTVRPADSSVVPIETAAGRLMGTPLYMSPEQSLGKAVDARSDVYALGVVLYEALTGAAPFVRASWLEVLMAHVSDPPPRPGPVGGALPDGLEAIVLRALAKEPADRFADMRAMRAALIEVMARPKVIAAPFAIAAAAVAVVAAALSPRAANDAVGAPIARHPLPGTGLADVLRRIIVTRLEAGRLVLPALPASVATTLTELRAPNADLAHVARILGTDPLIAPQLLNLASSAFFTSNRSPQTLLQAVIQLGVVRLRGLLLELSTRRVFASPRREVRAAFDGMWGHSLAVAELARSIVTELGSPVPADGVHLGGLIHDVGKPVVGAMLLEAEKLLGKRFVVDPATWIAVVTDTHRDVAVALTKSWNLDAGLGHVVAHCASYGDDLTTNIVCLANAVAKRAWRTVGPVDAEAADALIAEGADRLGLDWKFVHGLPHTLSALP